MPQPNQIFDRNLAIDRRKHALSLPGYPDFIEKVIADELVSRLSLLTKTFDRCLILGPASTQFLQIILQSGKVKTLVTLSENQSSFLAVGFDIEWLPFADNSFDCIIAPPGLEQVNDLAGVLFQINRALKPDGLFLGALFGGDTLIQLRQAWLLAENKISNGASPRVAPFADIRQTGNLLLRAGLALPVSDSERLTIRYETAKNLMHEIKLMGYANHLIERRKTLTGKQLFESVCKIYEQKFSDDDGRIRATVEINYLTAWCPHDSQQKPLKPGSAQHKIESFLQTAKSKKT